MIYPKTCWYREVCSKAPGHCTPDCIRYKCMLAMLKRSNIPEGAWVPKQLYPGADLEAFRRLAHIKNEINLWVKNGHNLYLYSAGCGNGKTSWAFKLALAYLNSVWDTSAAFRAPVIYMSVPEFFERERQSIRGTQSGFEELKEALISADLVIWDDITAVRITEYNFSLLQNYIDARVVNGKSNIFTGNYPEANLADFVGEKLCSRICSTSEQIEFVDRDKRGMRNG